MTVSEIRLGIAMMPDGKRKERLGELAEAMFQEDFSNNFLPFDCSAAKTYASIVSARIRQGRPISVEDARKSQRFAAQAVSSWQRAIPGILRG